MASSFETSRRVEFCETDMAGIVHFSNFYRWMEQAEHEFFRSLQLKIVYPQSSETIIGWPRVSASCRFESPAKYEDIIDVRLIVERIGVKSLTFKVFFTNNGRPVANGNPAGISGSAARVPGIVGNWVVVALSQSRVLI